MFLLKTLILCAAWLTIHCQSHNGPTTTPVPILKQINRQNDDGSYSYGYEAADGSFKIETKYPNGDVAGKYGYVDENGKTREISYGASSQRGFEPQGAGIMVPPPTLNHSPSNALTDGQEDDGQYREDPSIYEDPKYNSRAQPRPAPLRQYHQSEPAQAPVRYTQPAPTAAPAPQYTQYRQQQPVYTQQTNLFNQAPQQFPSQNQEVRPQSQVYHQQPQFSYQAFTPQPYQNFQSQNFPAQTFQPQYQPQQNYQAQNQNYNPFFGHPAQNFDPSSGSYSINFTG
ncbi:vacuolar protein sorting-associated protein 27-like [Trichoplusia ni]|uniref:Vacuolar protein sorting-associated protein 27-like n=1 Tax=Trichoplusia ni TaxID=7111 RepID=A0A7E5VXC2_TRINI|nr:vacuolar protein sorting-associated protein 27-like [Trichoplusia ni]